MTKTITIRTPRSIEAATPLCERFAVIESELQIIAETRSADIAAINARCDKPAGELIAERDLIAAKLEPWFLKNRDDLLEGKAKSFELGGVMLGVRKNRAVLTMTMKADDAADTLASERWSEPYTITKINVDRAGVLKALDGKHAEKLKALGFAEGGGDEDFYVKRTKQGGTRG